MQLVFYQVREAERSSAVDVTQNFTLLRGR
jgi:hypothetical protein